MLTRSNRSRSATTIFIWPGDSSETLATGTKRDMGHLSLCGCPGLSTHPVEHLRVRQQARQGAVDMARTRLGFQAVLVGRYDVAQAVNQVCEHGRRNATSPQHVLVTRCAQGCHVFAAWRWHTAMGSSLEAIDMTM